MFWLIEAGLLSGVIVFFLMVLCPSKNHRCWRALDSICIYGFSVPLKRCLHLAWDRNHGQWGVSQTTCCFSWINNPPNHLLLIREDTGQHQAFFLVQFTLHRENPWTKTLRHRGCCSAKSIHDFACCAEQAVLFSLVEFGF